MLRTAGIVMPTGNAMKRLEEGTVYKCLGISEDEIKHKQVKDETTREYFWQVRTIFKSKLNGGNISALNSRVMSIVGYRAWIIDWVYKELQQWTARPENCWQCWEHIIQA